MQRLSALVLPLVVLGAGCSFDVAGFHFDDGGTMDGAHDLAVGDQSFAAADLAGLCANGGPQTGCSEDGTALLMCSDGTPVPTACPSGCSNDGAPHCRGLDPGGPAMPSDYGTPGLGDITVGVTAVFDTDTGSINGGALQRNAGPGVDQGIGFRIAPQADGSAVGIFSFHSLTIVEGAEIAFIGSNAASLVAAGDIQIAGLIDAQGSCDPAASAYVGAGVGGAPTNGAGGAGAHGGGGGSHGGMSFGGGGGGGSGDVGGAGTSIGGGGTGGGAGAANGGLADPDPVLAGGGGGGAGSGTGMMQGGAGGAGGGAVQVAANGMIVLGALSIVQGGGCHGNPSASGGGGGGGGAGGAILLEASTFAIAGGAIIAANGGSGAGGGGDGQSGNDGQDGSDDALGGAGGGTGFKGAAGGNGGVSTLTSGDAAAPGSMGLSSGGGGGGAVGNIAFKSLNGMVDTSAAIVSPSIGAHSPGKPSPSIVGTASFD